MKLWRVGIYDAQSGSRLFWYSSQRSARAALRELRQAYEVQDERVDSVKVPTDKRGFLRWLNVNVHHDNDAR